MELTGMILRKESGLQLANLIGKTKQIPAIGVAKSASHLVISGEGVGNPVSDSYLPRAAFDR